MVKKKPQKIDGILGYFSMYFRLWITAHDKKWYAFIPTVIVLKNLGT